MPYTAEPPVQPPSPEELRSRIPGWGVDANVADRPSVPRERLNLETGAHWDFPERQRGGQRRERSVEHQDLPPVFGTAAPLKGLSGMIRRFAYDRFSEARAAHWLLLLAADRVDVIESHAASLGTCRPVNPLAKSGLRAEVTRHGWSSRMGAGRADQRHHWMDPILVYAPWAAVALAVVLLVRRRSRRRD